MLITKDSIKLGDKQLVGVAMIRKIRFSSLPPVRFFAFSLKCQSRRKGRKLVVGLELLEHTAGLRGAREQPAKWQHPGRVHRKGTIK
jgi:hypothetical protein